MEKQEKLKASVLSFTAKVAGDSIRFSNQDELKNKLTEVITKSKETVEDLSKDYKTKNIELKKTLKPIKDKLTKEERRLKAYEEALAELNKANSPQ